MFYPPQVHDLSFYQGKLYAYFSPLPALLLFLPYHLITGGWLSHQQGCFLFCFFGYVMAVALLAGLRRRFFAEVNDYWFATVAFALGLLTFSPPLLQRPDVGTFPTT
jgi:hypothetical protein